MTGLRNRLQAVNGVESIELELGDEGLEGITVRLAEGADEVAVLEGIRRLLVAYGTKAPRAPAVVASSFSSAMDAGDPDPVHDVAQVVVEESEPTHEVMDLDDQPNDLVISGSTLGDGTGPTEARLVTPEGDVVELSVLPAGDRSAAQVTVTWNDRAGRRQVPASSRAIVQAVIDVGAELMGREPISVIGMNLSSMERTRVLTVIAGNYGSSPRVCTASVVEHDWPSALLSILAQVLGVASDRD